MDAFGIAWNWTRPTFNNEQIIPEFSSHVDFVPNLSDVYYFFKILGKIYFCLKERTATEVCGK